MPLNPKQLKAYLEKLARERRAKEKSASGLLPGAGNPHQVAPPAIVFGDDDWLHDMRPGGASSPSDEKK